VRDQGAKILSSLCSSIAAKDEAGIDKVLEGIPDPVGTFYRYGLAKSILRRKVDLSADQVPSPK
jgi:F420-non-reducing hydrogenase small subunit